MRRLLSSFLAILVLFLSVQPVCAVVPDPFGGIEENCCASSADYAEENNAPDNTGNEKGCKGCNPFQSCHCCISGVMMPEKDIAATAFIPAGNAPHWARWTERTHPVVSLEFWQPPKITGKA